MFLLAYTAQIPPKHKQVFFRPVDVLGINMFSGNNNAHHCIYMQIYICNICLSRFTESTIWHLLAVCPFTDLFDGGICCYSYWCIMNVLFIKYHFICHGYMLELLYILSCEKEKKSFCDVTETRNPERSIFHELTYRGLSTGS